MLRGERRPVERMLPSVGAWFLEKSLRACPVLFMAEVFLKLQTSQKGLSASVAEERRMQGK
jgi:hypothetical protein